MADRKVLFSGRDFCQDPATVLSGGSWTDLDNILVMRPQLAAQATDNEPESTQFEVDLGSSQPVGLLFFARLMASKSGEIIITCSESADYSSPTYEVDTTCWPSDSDALAIDHWGNFSIDGLYRQETFSALNYNRFFVPEEPVLMRYIKVEINDTTADNKLIIGCFGACEVYEPEHDIASDWRIDFDDLSEIGATPYGSVFPTERYQQRVLSVGLQKINMTEYMSQVLDVILMHGKRKPIVVLPFSNNTFQEKVSVYGLISATPSMSNPFVGLFDTTFQIKELP